MGRDRDDSLTFDFEPNIIPFGSKSKGNRKLIHHFLTGAKFGIFTTETIQFMQLRKLDFHSNSREHDRSDSFLFRFEPNRILFS